MFSKVTAKYRGLQKISHNNFPYSTWIWTKMEWKKIVFGMVQLFNVSIDYYWKFKYLWPADQETPTTASTEFRSIWYAGWKLSKYGVTFGPYFPAFGLNTEIYSVNLRIQSEYRKIRTRNDSVFGHFSRSGMYSFYPGNYLAWNLKYELLGIHTTTWDTKFCLINLFRIWTNTDKKKEVCHEELL